MTTPAVPNVATNKVTPQETTSLSSASANSTSSSNFVASKRGRYVSPGQRTAKLPTAQNELLLSPKNTTSNAFPATPKSDFSTEKCFDTSNVLAWLQSPTGLLFSPTSPKQPVVSTSFFFRDVAEHIPDSEDEKIICISPLASKYNPGSSWKDVFCSPTTTIAHAKASPAKGMDAVLTERNLDDPDLNVLLHGPPALPTSSETANSYKIQPKTGKLRVEVGKKAPPPPPPPPPAYYPPMYHPAAPFGYYYHPPPPAAYHNAAAAAAAATKKPKAAPKKAKRSTPKKQQQGGNGDDMGLLRGVTMRPSGKWQAQLYFCGKSRYIGVFESREKAALAYEIAREQLKNNKSPSQNVESLVNAARKAAFDGVHAKWSNSK